MCRVLAYLGRPVVVEQLLYRSDSSLVRQVSSLGGDVAPYVPAVVADFLNTQ